tara:strand:+ start:99 stop:413 length:315 start_codon:yes stop_codon:yes gene_type:complete
MSCAAPNEDGDDNKYPCEPQWRYKPIDSIVMDDAHGDGEPVIDCEYIAVLACEDCGEEEEIKEEHIQEAMIMLGNYMERYDSLGKVLRMLKTYIPTEERKRLIE